MSDLEEWCAEKRSKLLHDELRINTLLEIKEHLSTLPQEEASITASCLDIPLVFDCLNDTDLNQVDLACEVLTLSMKNLSLGETTTRYCDQLERALKHPYTQVKLMALKELDRYTMNDDLLLNLCRRLSLIHSILNCVGDGDLSVSKNAAKIILQLGCTKDGIKILLFSETVGIIDEIMGVSEVVRLRLYDVLINISKESEDSHNALVNVGLYKNVINDATSKDILLKMNVIEMMSSLAVTPHGYSFLERQGVMLNLFKYLTPDANQLDQQICEPGVLKFFGHIANWKPIEVFSKYQTAVNRLFRNLKSDDLVVYAVSADTIGHIAETNQGKLALDSQDQKIFEAISGMSNRLVDLPIEIKVRTLKCFESLLRLDSNEHQFELITNKWFRLFGDDPMSFVLGYCKNSIPELRLAGFGVLLSISSQVWGQEYVKNTPGLLEFLMDRGAERKKECKEIKYEIVCTLSNGFVFNNLERMQLESFVKQGPFYQQGITEVAVEGDD